MESAAVVVVGRRESERVEMCDLCCTASNFTLGHSTESRFRTCRWFETFGMHCVLSQCHGFLFTSYLSVKQFCYIYTHTHTGICH